MRYLFTTLAAAVFVATPAFAQEEMNNFLPEEGDWEFIISGSGSSDEDVEVGSFAANLELGYYLTQDWEVALRQSVIYNDTGAGTNWDGSTRVAIDYHFGDANLRPFIGANLGYVYGDATDDRWAAGPEAGLKWYVKDETFVYGRVEYQFFFEDSDEIDDEFDDGQFIYTVGIGFNF